MHSSSKKVLVLYHSSLAVCGIGTWIEMLSELLTDRGWEVVVGLAWGLQFHDPARVEKARPRLKTVWMDGRTGTEEGRIQAIERTIRQVNPDIVIVNCLHAAFEAVRRLRLAGQGRFRFIAMNHGNLPVQAACLLAEKDVIDMAVCVGKLSYRAMSEPPSGFAAPRIRHVSNAVPLPVCPKEQAELSGLRIGYAARLDDDKRAGDIFPFVRELRAAGVSFEFWIAGSGGREKDVTALAGELPDQVRYFGQLTRDELYRSFYPRLDMLVHFSASEGWGLTLAEAMVHGVVPVTSAFRGIGAEGLVMDDENGVTFPAGDIGAAVRIIVALDRDRERLNRLADAAASHVRNHYTPEAFRRAWASVLEDCLDLPSLPAPLASKSRHAKGRLGIREKNWETIRRLLRRRVVHRDIGAEWPHFQCGNRELVAEMSRLLERLAG